jgi:hypothetical protein
MCTPREKERLAQLDELDTRHWTLAPEFSRVRTERVSGLAVDDYLMLPEQHLIASSSQIFFRESERFFEK